MMKYAIVFLAAFAAAALAHDDHAGHQHLRAVAYLRGPDLTVQGNVTFEQLHDGTVHVVGALIGLEPGRYGFHVHERGDLTGGCLSTGGHFNPEQKPHGAPNDTERHVGDLGNVIFDADHVARVDIVDSQLSLTGAHGILGRAVVLHSGEDDLGRGGHPDSRKTGNAGGRVACGVIGIL